MTGSVNCHFDNPLTQSLLGKTDMNFFIQHITWCFFLLLFVCGFFLLSVDVEDEATTGEVSKNLNLSTLHMLQEVSVSKAIDISLAKVRLTDGIYK